MLEVPSHTLSVHWFLTLFSTIILCNLERIHIHPWMPINGQGIYVGSYSNSPASSSLVFMMPPPIRSCSKCADPLRRVAAISFPFSLCQRHSLLCRRECFGKYFGILLFFSKCVYLAFNWQILQHLNCTFPGHSSWNDGSDSYHLYWLGPQIPPRLPHIQFFPIPIAAPTHPTNPLGTPADFDTGWRAQQRQKQILSILSTDPPASTPYRDISKSFPSHRSHQPPWNSS